MFHHPQSLPCSVRPDLILEVGLEPAAANLASRIPCEDQQVAGNPTSCIPCEDLLPVIFEIPSGSPDLEEELPQAPESPQCPDTPGKWFQPPTRSPPRSRSSSPPSPRHPRKRSPSYWRWCELRIRESGRGSIGYRGRCPPVTQIKRNLPLLTYPYPHTCSQQ